MSLVSSVTSVSATTTDWINLTYLTTITDRVLPTPLTCGGSKWPGISGANVVQITPLNNATWPYLTKCCGNLPIAVQQGDKNCAASCDIGHDSTPAKLRALRDCFKVNGQNLPGIDDVSYMGFIKDFTPTTSSTTPSATASASPSTTKASSSTRSQSMGKTEIIITSMMLVSVLAAMML